MSVFPALIAPELNPKVLFAPPFGAPMAPGLETEGVCVKGCCDCGRLGAPDVCNSQRVGSRGTGTGGGGGDATRPKGLLTPPVRCVLTAWIGADAASKFFVKGVEDGRAGGTNPLTLLALPVEAMKPVPVGCAIKPDGVEYGDVCI